MDVKQITPFLSAIDSLSHAKHFSYMTRIRDRAKDYVVTPLGEGLPANLKSAYQTLNMAVVNEDSAYKSQRGSDLTALIKEADDVRDNTLSGIKSMLDALSRIGTDEQKAAVVKVQRQMDVYKLKSTDSYEEEGIKIQQFCADCNVDLQLEQALTALGLVGQVRTLGEQNEQCRRLVNQRNEQRSFTDNQAMQKARKVTDAAYADFVMMLNAYNVVSLGTSQGQYEQAIQIINADIDYYKQWVLRKGGSSDEGGEDEEPETDGGNSDGGSEVTPVTPEPTPSGGDVPNIGSGD